MKGKVYQLFNASFAVFYNDIKYTVLASLALQYLAVDELRFDSNKFRDSYKLHVCYCKSICYIVVWSLKKY